MVRPRHECCFGSYRGMEFWGEKEPVWFTSLWTHLGGSRLACNVRLRGFLPRCPDWFLTDVPYHFVFRLERCLGGGSRGLRWEQGDIRGTPTGGAKTHHISPNMNGVGQRAYCCPSTWNLTALCSLLSTISNGVSLFTSYSVSLWRVGDPTVCLSGWIHSDRGVYTHNNQQWNGTATNLYLSEHQQQLKLNCYNITMQLLCPLDNFEFPKCPYKFSSSNEPVTKPDYLFTSSLFRNGQPLNTH